MTLAHALQHARLNTDTLLDTVCPGSLYERPIAERHRIIFYLGHLEAFDWNLIARGPLDLPSFHPEFDHLFAFGIDPGPGNLPADQPHDWPRVEDVRRYNQRVRATLDPLLEQVPEQLLQVAIEHRLMHSETFAYMLHQLPYAQKIAPQRAPVSSSAAPGNRMVEVPGGTVMLGRKRGDGFGWDNEFEANEVAVQDFSAARYKVTNGAYLQFVNAGGPPPVFWSQRAGSWFYRGMWEELPLPLDWPVYVSLDQARQYAAWAGKRLLTEAEFHRAAYNDGAALGERDNFDFQHWDPIPVQASGENSLGLAQMVGNGWEWTSTSFAPFPGFEPFPFYPGYSANFFDGEHFVLKGASPRTAACMARPSFRNWFRASYPYMYATFRVVED